MVNDLRQRVDVLTRGQKSAVLIADEQLRHVCASNLIDTDVRCKRGEKIAEAAWGIRDLNRGHDQLTVLIGGNDCTSNEPSTAETIVEKYSGLIDTAKEKARNVSLVSIPPQIPSQEVRDRIEPVKAGLSIKCKEKNVNFIDNAPMFILGDGTINDSYLETDGVHLTVAATNRLSKNLGLRLKDSSKRCVLQRPTATDI